MVRATLRWVDWAGSALATGVPLGWAVTLTATLPTAVPPLLSDSV